MSSGKNIMLSPVKMLRTELRTIASFWLKHYYKATHNSMRDNPSFANYKIGQYSYGSAEILYASDGAKLAIGGFCSISENVIILLGGEHRIDWMTSFPFTAFFKEALQYKEDGHRTKGDVTIGNDVWIGRNVMILSGVTIGDGCVIGAGAVVTKSIPPYAIAAGNPAKVIRMRFDEKTIERLLWIKWWNWSIDKVLANLPYLLSNNSEKFININSN
jgi:acetyltransferase-like isoleucine patch superfamily enzyme